MFFALSVRRLRENSNDFIIQCCRKPLIKYSGSRFDEIGPDARREGRVDMGYLNRPSQHRRWANLVKTLRAQAWRAVCGFGCQTRRLMKGTTIHFVARLAAHPAKPARDPNN